MNELSDAMTAVALKGLAGRKLRAILTALAIVLGVAMISGTYVLTDTIDKAFDSVFTESYAGTDAVVTGKEAFSSDFGQPPPFPEERRSPRSARCRASSAAVGAISDSAQLTQEERRDRSTQGAPSLAFGIDFAEHALQPAQADAGRLAVGAGRGGDRRRHGRQGGLRGRRHRSAWSRRGPAQEFTITGIAKYGVGRLDRQRDVRGLHDSRRRRSCSTRRASSTAIQAAAKDGVTPAAARRADRADPAAGDAGADRRRRRRRIRRRTSRSSRSSSATSCSRSAASRSSSARSSSSTRSRSRSPSGCASSRRCGRSARSRRQMLGSVILEALVIGLIASIVGLFLGLGLAKGLNSVLGVVRARSADRPAPSSRPRTVIVSLLAGRSDHRPRRGIVPAIRATRVPPIAAVREGATLPRSRFARSRRTSRSSSPCPRRLRCSSTASFVNGIGDASAPRSRSGSAVSCSSSVWR